MVENKDLSPQNGQESEKITPKSFLFDIAKGFLIGVAFIIPGFSGGTVAAVIGVYEKLVGAIAGLFTSFKRSFLTILPIFIGLVLGAVSLMYPLSFFLELAPIPTVSLFVGLTVGALSPIFKKAERKIGLKSVLAFIIPLALCLSLLIIPSGSEVDLFGLNIGGYLILFLVGIVGSTALVIPGISGSMILLILGFYNPIISVIKDNFLKGENMLTAFLILMSVGLGIIVGFIGISVVMKRLLIKYQALTYTAILGFIIGSIPTVFISTASDAGYTLATLPTSPLYWIMAVLMLAVGISVSIIIIKLANKKAEE